MKPGYPGTSILALLLPLLVAQAMLLGCVRSMMPTPMIYRNSGTPIVDELDPELRGNQIPVLYVTDRKFASEDTRGSRFCGSERSTSSAFAVAQVAMGAGTGSWEASAEQKEKSDHVSELTSRSSIKVVSADELVRFPATPYRELERIGPTIWRLPDPVRDH